MALFVFCTICGKAHIDEPGADGHAWTARADGRGLNRLEVLRVQIGVKPYYDPSVIKEDDLFALLDLAEAAAAYVDYHPDHGVHPPPIDEEACETRVALTAALTRLQGEPTEGVSDG